MLFGDGCIFGRRAHIISFFGPDPEAGEEKKGKEGGKRRWRGTEIAPNGAWRAQGFLGMEFCCHYYQSRLCI